MNHRLDQLPSRELASGLRVHEAQSLRARMAGLMLLDAMPQESALRIEPCASVHTVGMRFALDLVWLAKDDTLVRVDRGVRPRRLKGCRGAHAVVECGAGRADAFLAAGLARAAP